MCMMRECPSENLMKSHNVLRELFHAREGFRREGSQGKPWKLETRLDCIELAEEQRYEIGSLIYYTGQQMDHMK